MSMRAVVLVVAIVLFLLATAAAVQGRRLRRRTQYGAMLDADRRLMPLEPGELGALERSRALQRTAGDLQPELTSSGPGEEFPRARVVAGDVPSKLAAPNK